VYWDDSGGGSTINWANSVILSGGNLDWQSAGLSVSGLGSNQAVAILDTATKYRNYYFRLAKGGEINIVRTFPANFDSINGPRYQNNYAHGNFASDTDMCAKCHSTHNSVKAQLLKQATYYELCLTCHGNSSTQSKYDVQMGQTYTGEAWVDSLAGPIGNGMGTSSHNIDDRNSVDTTVYGSDPAQILTFTCMSCHLAHGGTDDNYRLIRRTIYPANDKAWNPQTVNFQAYAVVNDITVGEQVYFVSGASEFCAACHLDYIKGNAYNPGGVYTYVYRHPVSVGNTVYSVEPKNYWPSADSSLPLQYYAGASTDDKRTTVVCQTCHYAHGTKRNFSVYIPPEPLPIIKKNMLRVDNLGVCESCHKK
jgi:predicted CXXCH cytochrome family protein